MKLQFISHLISCKGGELLGVVHNPSNGTTKLVILREDGEIEEVETKYIHKCKIVTNELNPKEKHR